MRRYRSAYFRPQRIYHEQIRKVLLITSKPKSRRHGKLKKRWEIERNRFLSFTQVSPWIRQTALSTSFVSHSPIFYGRFPHTSRVAQSTPVQSLSEGVTEEWSIAKGRAFTKYRIWHVSYRNSFVNPRWWWEYVEQMFIIDSRLTVVDGPLVAGRSDTIQCRVSGLKTSTSNEKENRLLNRLNSRCEYILWGMCIPCPMLHSLISTRLRLLPA